MRRAELGWTADARLAARLDECRGTWSWRLVWAIRVSWEPA
jgi:hypothetical protein